VTEEVLNLAFVLETLHRNPGQFSNREITAVAIDSREAIPGSIFVAFRGEHVDGHDYVADAFEHGAIMALVQRPIDGVPIFGATEPLSTLLPDQPFCLLVDDTLLALQDLGRAWRTYFPDLRVVGITGSVGKTSTKELTHAILSERFCALKSAANLNNEIGLPLTLLNLRQEHEIAVLEMGMYTTGEIGLLCELARPQIGVVTLVGSVHMEWLGSLEAIAAAKQELVEALPAAPEGVAILNRDDPLVWAMANHTQARVFSYGLDPTSDLWADDIVSMGLNGVRFRLHSGDEALTVSVPLLGRHSVHTALRATAVGLTFDMAWDDIVRGLHGLESQLRLVAVPGPQGSVILDDTYNSSPESAVAALNLLGDLPARRLAVLGDMLELGPAEEGGHRLVGRRASEVADILITVGNRAEVIAEEALSAGMRSQNVYITEDVGGALTVLEEVIGPKDMILVKGSRGMRMDRIVAALERR
jgi:UDP-N-acetylmuramoyl-tripeptide--D-alanyl-D-alanine ligase